MSAGVNLALFRPVSLRILIVDDEPNHRRSLAVALRLAGFATFEAGDGEAALRRLEVDAEIDVAILDLMMPGMSGLELARRMRVRHPQVRLMLTSAYHLSRRQLERTEIGISTFLPKPFDVEQLVSYLGGKAPLTTSPAS